MIENETSKFKLKIFSVQAELRKKCILPGLLWFCFFINVLGSVVFFYFFFNFFFFFRFCDFFFFCLDLQETKIAAPT